MARLSMSDIWDETRAFLAREKALILPLGFATFGLALLLLALAAPAEAAAQAKPGLWMLWLVPGFLLITIGYLAVSAIVLTPNISVGESLGVAMKRLPSAISLTFLMVGAMLLLLIISIMLFGVVGAQTGMSLERAAIASVVVALVPMFWLSIRLIIVWPLLVVHDAGPADAIRRSFALTAGNALPIAGILLLFGMVYLLTTGVAQIAGGSVFLLIGRAIGMPHIGHSLAGVLVAGVGGLLATMWTLFLALLYRRLAGSSNGT